MAACPGVYPSKILPGIRDSRMQPLNDPGVNAYSSYNLPYLTGPDSSLARSSGGRDPLGLQPVWSAVGRQLVPHIASPVRQIGGIKAVLLIHWLVDRESIRKLMKSGRERGFFRLMEGLVEYWFRANERSVCFGSQSLAAAAERFAVTVNARNTVANGLHQYYRGSCRRAGLLDGGWKVRGDLQSRLEKLWDADATRALATAIAPCMSGRPLVAGTVLADAAMNRALLDVFDSEDLNKALRETLFGSETHRSLVREYGALRRREHTWYFGQDHASLSFPQLANELEDMRRCEPFLVTLQDVFDLARADAGSSLDSFASKLQPHFDAMHERAREFLMIADRPGGERMRRMQVLAAALLPEQGRGRDRCLRDFVGALVRHHVVSMDERGRDPMMFVEGGTLVLSAPGDRDVEDANRRLQEGYPWMNGYYLDAAADLYEQLYGEVA